MINPKRQSFYDFSIRTHASSATLDCSDSPSRTVQSQREEADINVILRRFNVTGQLPTVKMPPMYGDFTGVSDYRSALDLVRAADDSFMSMSPDVRTQFGNNPALFVAFCQNPANREQLKKWGMIVPEPEEKKPVKVEVVTRPDASTGGSAPGAAAGTPK